jgi:Fuc2NAc and GlcNAc transferase
MMVMVLAFGTAALLSGWWGTRWVTRRAEPWGLIDIANARSMHRRPTPRGGGLAVVVTVFLGTLILWVGVQLRTTDAVAVWGGAVAIGGIGLLDDRYGVSSKLRFLVHIGTAMVVMVLVHMPSESALKWSFTVALAVLAITWSINLFNFMDGIDGLAGSEACMVLGWYAAAAAWLWPDGSHLLALGASAAVFGFLAWNWPPARIFMGDVGSGFLGFLIAFLAIRAWSHEPLLTVTTASMYSYFWVDASVTLFVRLRTGQNVFQAHRLHAYQKRARLSGSHSRVSLQVIALNALWLLPWNILVVTRQLPAIALTIPTLGVAWYVLQARPGLEPAS